MDNAIAPLINHYTKAVPGGNPRATLLQLPYYPQGCREVAPELLTVEDEVWINPALVSATNSADTAPATDCPDDHASATRSSGNSASTTSSPAASSPTTGSLGDRASSKSSPAGSSSAGYAHQLIRDERLEVRGPATSESTASAWQAYGTARRVNDTFERYWEGEALYRHPGQETLTINIAHPAAQEHGPFYKALPHPAIYTNSANTAADPDIIAHEQGHAILDSYCHYNTYNSFAASAHEAFADSTALITALQSPQVRADLSEALERGEHTTLLSVIGEGSRELTGGRGTLPGLRDLADAGNAAPETASEEAHGASRRFSHGLYQSLVELTDQLQRSLHLAPREALDCAAQRISADFVNCLHFLPRQPIISQRDLALAVLAANRTYGQGLGQEVYRSCWQDTLTTNDAPTTNNEPTTNDEQRLTTSND